MNEKAYAKAVAKRLACSKARRDEFVHDLESDISSALAAGEAWEQVERRMGDPRDVAREFNEGLSEGELAAGRKRRRLRAAGVAAVAVVVVVAVLAAAAWWVFPKATSPGAATGLDEQAAVERAQEVVTLLDADDFDALRALSDETMAKALDATSLEAARASFSDDWGAFEAFGNAYAFEARQLWVTQEVVEMVAIYENITVTYDIVFESDMRLSSFYIK
ncbi:MAG: DUF3887 domain-containing protein [Gordonibacter pamelaeae]